MDFEEDAVIPNYEKSLPARIRDLELQRSRAVVGKDWTKASEIAERIAELKAALQVALKPKTQLMSEAEIEAGEARLPKRLRYRRLSGEV